MIPKYLCSIAVIICFAACDSSRVPEVNVIGVISDNAVFSRESLRALASQVADVEDLAVVYEGPPAGHREFDSKCIINLRPRSKEKILVTISANIVQRRLRIGATNNVAPVRAEAIVAQATLLAKERFPNSHFQRFDRKQGIFGP